TIGRAADPLEADADRQADRVLGALRRRAAAGAGEHAGHSSRISRMAALVGGSIRRVLSGAAAIADAAKKIANGHSFDKHVTRQAEFTAQKITTVDQFETHISSVISSTTSKNLGGGRSAYWDDATGTIVIVNPGAADMGTCFRPTAGKSYYDKQV
ncbi:MAG: fhaB 1, partial [Jatrophihabitans sp.]|nr:fhaB 1 [Jatrophihabitans sp.]